MQAGSSRSTERVQGLAAILLRPHVLERPQKTSSAGKPPPVCHLAVVQQGEQVCCIPAQGAGGCPGVMQVVMVQQSSSGKQTLSFSFPSQCFPYNGVAGNLQDLINSHIPNHHLVQLCCPHCILLHYAAVVPWRCSLAPFTPLSLVHELLIGALQPSSWCTKKAQELLMLSQRCLC